MSGRRTRSVPARRRRAGSPLAALVVHDEHEAHRVRARDHEERPARLGAILRGIEPLAARFERVPARRWPLRHVLAIHDQAMVDFLRRAAAAAPKGRPIYPDVFPIRNADRLPKALAARTGYYCFDACTPIVGATYRAAKRAVDCALTAADEVLRGRRFAYALVRPPGHHAERRRFGGFCYLNGGAAAAQHLSGEARVAMLDVDYHHGNGQQDIFYERADVLTVSIHADPALAYPHFSGFADETGAGPGLGLNVNLPLPGRLTGRTYRIALQQAAAAVDRFDPDVLVVPLGLDGAAGDPLGSWRLEAADFRAIGRGIRDLGRPTLVVQEGGYLVRTLGASTRAFFGGLLGDASS